MGGLETRMERGSKGNMGMETQEGNDDDEAGMLRYICEEHVYDHFFFCLLGNENYE